MNQLASALTGLEGERVALCDVAVSATLQDLLAEVTVSQTYRNDEQASIEAVYTFPLPLDAVLLELEVEIGGRVLQGVVVEKKAAEERYEDAVEAGDAAVMLEAIEPGLYTMNVGNLLSQETAKITFRYAILYRWSGDRLRLLLPTTIAPRYGASPHLPHQVPEASLTVENRFSLRLEISGALRDAQFACPSHAVELAKSLDKVVLSLTQAKTVMDRDFVLNVRAPQAPRSFALCGEDGDGASALASFQPFFPGLHQPRPLTLAIAIDCSDSMNGDSIAQAKQALDGILECLQPQDRVTLIAFGSTTRALSDRLLPCNKTNLAKAKRFARSLEANLGGTEIGVALRETYAALAGAEPGDVFLVTDGEVGAWETVVDEATRSGHRIFTVGVGSAVSEAFVRQLGASTGGECELVSPREGMAERVVRHFERMRAPRARRVAVRWPDGATNVCPSRIAAVFEGDTVVASAAFDRPVANGCAILEIETDDGEVVRQELAIPPAAPCPSPDGISTVARVAAAARLKELDDAAALAAALRYRLVSRWTNWLVVAPRSDEEKAHEIPALRTVPQTLAAGWGGVGHVAMCVSSVLLAPPAGPRPSAAWATALDASDLPESVSPRRTLPVDLPEPCRRLLELIGEGASRLDAAGALDLLTQSGLAVDFDEAFRDAAELGLDADVVAAIVLAHLLSGPMGEFLSDDAQMALASLQGRAREAMDALREMARHGSALARLIRGPAARELLLPRSDDESVGRFARMRKLVDELEKALRRTREHFEPERPAHAHLDGEEIA
jgi:Ca-activated chloride channel family protein